MSSNTDKRSPAEQIVAEIHQLRVDAQSVNIEQTRLLWDLVRRTEYVVANTRQIANWAVGIGILAILSAIFAALAVINSRI